MKKLLAVMAFIALLTSLASVSIDHFSPGIYVFGTDVEIRLNAIYGADEINSIKLKWKRVGEEAWREEAMTLEATGSFWYVAELRAGDLQDYDVEYYFEVLLTSGNVENIPTLDGLEPLYRLSPGSVIGTRADEFILLSDETNPSQGNEYILAVSYFDLMDRIDLSSIRVWVGGRDVTRRATITENALIYRDSDPNPGSRRSQITAMVDGQQVYSPIWTTEVPRNPHRPFLPLNIRGNFNLATNVYSLSADGDTDSFLEREDDATAMLDLYSTYGILNTQANFLVSTMEDSKQQAVNRYTFGLQLPVLDVWLGDSSPSLSSFSMANRNVRGIWTKLHSRFLSLEVAHGEMLRATKTSFLDGTSTERTLGTFKQEALGARFQMGNKERMLLGITATRNRDIHSSLKPEDYSYTDGGETIFTAKPKDNAVVAVDIRLNLPEQLFTAGGEIAGSLLNNNTLDAALTQEEIEEYLPEDLPININPADFADYFIINRNMEPLVPGRENLAWTGYVRMHFLKNLIDFRYTEVGPAFNALSTYYQQNDTKMISVSDQLNIKNIMILSGGANLLADNLSGHKQETSETLSWNAQMALRIPQWPYLKAAYFSNNSSNERNPSIVDNDYVYVPYERSSGLLSFGIGYDIQQLTFVPTLIDLTYRMGNDDNTTNANQLYENLNNSFNVSINNRWSTIPLRTQIVFAYQQNKRDTSSSEAIYPLFDNNNTNLFLSADYSLLNRKLRPFVQYKLLNLGGDQDKQGFNYFTLGLEATPLRDMTVGTQLNIQDYGNDADSSLDYNNLTWRFTLNQRF